MIPDIEALTSYFKQKGPVVLLESQSSQYSRATKTYLAALPETELFFKGKNGILKQKSSHHNLSGNPWQILQDFQEEHQGWLFGYLGYDLKNTLENLRSKNPDVVGAPDLYFMNPGFLLEINHKSQTAKVLKGELPGAGPFNTGSQKALSQYQVEAFTPTITKERYIAQIKEVQRRIKEGEFYELNLSHQMKGRFHGDTLALYKAMKAVGPVPFGAYLQINDLSICCQSPERFLRKSGQKIVSQPIKGTARRGLNAKEDRQLKEQLRTSSKERAENLMIVDLVRNDLNRIARSGSVSVPGLFDIHTFDTVHQMVSTVTANSTKNPVSILKACFPMGSMTGAPKISAMENIEELEDYRRGIYSGAIGYLTPQGNFDFNVVIRTAQVKGKQLYYSTGGAITADSDPESEWEETLIKAEALAKANHDR